MLILEDKPTAFFDVDDTLVLWDSSIEDKINEGILIGEGTPYAQLVVPHKKHIESLIQHKLRGHKIIVWSQGGPTWGAMVIKALKLEDYVDVVVNKPNFYYDDLPVELWMPACNRIWKNPKNGPRKIVPTNTVEESND